MTSLNFVHPRIWFPVVVGVAVGLFVFFLLTALFAHWGTVWLAGTSLLIGVGTSVTVATLGFREALLHISQNIKHVAGGAEGPSGENVFTQTLKQEFEMIPTLLHMARHSETPPGWLQTEIGRFKTLALDRPAVQSLDFRFKKIEERLIRAAEYVSALSALHDALETSTNEMNRSAKEMAEDAQKTSRTANEGIKTVGNEIRAMSDLKFTVGSSATIIDELNEMSRHVAEFVTTIGNISRRTQLLALNAGIEAARAGEAGRGFSVVASEIRMLSESSKSVTQEIENLISEINTRTTNVVDVMRNTGKLEDNIKVVYTAGDTFMHIVREVRMIENLVQAILKLSNAVAENNRMMKKSIEELRNILHEGQKLMLELSQDYGRYLQYNDKLNALFDGLQARLERTSPEPAAFSDPSRRTT